MTKPLEERFWSKVNKTDTCWLWIGNKDTFGYGRFKINGKRKQAHRVSWELLYGEITDDKCALHKCDNPSCVNPYHLFLGTRKDNMLDKIIKNRQVNVRGAKHWKAKVTELEVRKIRKLALQNLTTSKLSKLFGISRGAIYQIIKRKSWKHI